MQTEREGEEEITPGFRVKGFTDKLGMIEFEYNAPSITSHTKRGVGAEGGGGGVGG